MGMKPRFRKDAYRDPRKGRQSPRKQSRTTRAGGRSTKPPEAVIRLPNGAFDIVELGPRKIGVAMQPRPDDTIVWFKIKSGKFKILDKTYCRLVLTIDYTTRSGGI